jgi:hypothetical protein
VSPIKVNRNHGDISEIGILAVREIHQAFMLDPRASLPAGLARESGHLPQYGELSLVLLLRTESSGPGFRNNVPSHRTL